MVDMNAAGKTLTADELPAGTALPVFVMLGDTELAVAAVDVFAGRVELHTEEHDPEGAAVELLGQYLRKEITAAQLRTLAAEIV